MEAETGCSYDDIARIARDYATAEHAMIIQNMGGYQRTENGAYATATQVYLALFTGNVGHTGDGVYDVGGVSRAINQGGLLPTKRILMLRSVPASLAFISASSSWRTSRIPSISHVVCHVRISPPRWPNTNMVKEGSEEDTFRCDESTCS